MKEKTPSSMTIEEIVDELNKSVTTRQRTKEERERYIALHNEYRKKAKAYREKQKQKYNKEAKKATGLYEGNKVEYACISPFGFADFLTGTVVKYRGKLQVRLDEKFSGKRYTFLHKGWKKIK